MPTAPPVHRPPGWTERKPFANSRTAAKRVTGRKLQDRNLRIKTRDMFTCQQCGLVTAPRFLQVDHRRPLAEGGTEDDSNLQSLCIVGPDGGCHGAKSKQEAAIGSRRGVQRVGGEW